MFSALGHLGHLWYVRFAKVIKLLRCMEKALEMRPNKLENCSLVPRLFLPPVFDHLQYIYAYCKQSKTGGGNEARKTATLEVIKKGVNDQIVARGSKGL